MFNFIRNLFNYRYQLVTDDQYYKSMKGEPKDSLTQAELQMLQRIVAERIFLEEAYRIDSKENAKHNQTKSVRDMYYKEAKKISLKIKKLSALQYRLKHKIAAKG